MKSKSNKDHSFKFSCFQSYNLTRCIPCECILVMKSFTTTSGEHWQVWRERLTFYLTFTSPSEFYNTFSYSNDWIGRFQWVWFNLTILLRWDNTTDFWFHMGHEQRSPRWKFFDQIFLSGPRLMTSSFAAIILLQPLEGTPWKYTNLTCDTLVWSFYLIRTGSTSTLSFLSPHISPSKNSPGASLRAEHLYWNMLHVTPPVAGKQTWLGALTYDGREEVAPSPCFPFHSRTPTTVT